MQLETIRAVLTADSAQFVSGMNRAQLTMGRLTETSAQSHKALNILKSGMVGLATQATGTAGPVGKLAQGLLMFGGGGPLVLGVAAGIGVLSIAYQGLTRDARDNAKAQEDLVKALQGVGVHAQLTAAKITLSGLQAKQGAGQTVGETFSQFLNDMTGGAFGTSREQQKQGIASAIATQLNVIAGLEQQVAKWSKDIADNAEREAEARARTASLLRVVSDEGLLAAARLQGGSLFQRDQARMRGQLGNAIVRNDQAELNGDFFRIHAREIFLKSGISESVKQLGVSVGRQFVMGMLEGVQSLQDLFKMVFLSFLDFGLGQIFNKVLNVGSVVGVKSPPVGTVQFSLNASGMPAATNPLAAARDAQWQSFLRESVLVASSQGFRGAK